MSRAKRLLDLLQILRRHRYPVSGRALAAELGISLRTLYRDIDILRAQGASIEGEAGLGYVLQPGFMLPPLMFSEEEIEALVLGSRWVAQRTDKGLAGSARSAIDKIAAVLPADLRRELDATTLFVGPGARKRGDGDVSVLLRRAIRTERKLAMHYADEKGRASVRTVWPFALAFFDDVRVMAAWCELRSSFRHFRIDRIADAQVLDARYPRRRQAMLKEWRIAEKISLP